MSVTDTTVATLFFHLFRCLLSFDEVKRNIAGEIKRWCISRMDEFVIWLHLNPSHSSVGWYTRTFVTASQACSLFLFINLDTSYNQTFWVDSEMLISADFENCIVVVVKQLAWHLYLIAFYKQREIMANDLMLCVSLLTLENLLTLNGYIWR